jgi:serine/threonine protein kinase/formylglycine-generating enzyme required for sulfatase activity
MSQADTDRNLLFGIVALQMDFVAREALIAGMNAWALQKHKPLGQVLVEHGALSESRRALLEPLVQEHVRAHDDDPARSLAAVESANSIRRDLARVADPDIRASLDAATAARGGEHAQTYATSADDPDQWNPRFRILRPHAKGGLGEVFVARDVELNRQVALKEIQHQHADIPASRARFVLEAEITGALEHPGIVPVYGLGHYPDGRPFYAMRFVKGDNLGDAIKRFHAAERTGRDPGARALEFRKLLGRFVDVCNAIAYAHSKGVLHRDLKPDNVMLGKYGETLVVDWGLAKAIGQADPSLHPDEEPVAPSSGGSGVETLPGKALGTPQFMSPEQAAGELDRLGPQSDVYSLGATLYTVLTGRLAFEGRDVGVVLQKVLRGEFPSPRQANPDVPRPLEAICLKAMALKPEGRYATPRALAEDVERWLADEPVFAYREPWTTRARRWIAHHRTTVTATTAAVTVALVACGYFLYDACLRAAQRRVEANGRVEALLTAQVRAVPAIIDQLGADRRLVRDRLARLASGEGTTSAGRISAALALLADDPAQADFLAEYLIRPESSPDEVLVIRDALVDHGCANGFASRLRRRASPNMADILTPAQLRAAGALARMAPTDASWSSLAGPTAATLVRENPLYLGTWREVFRPVAGRLAGPLRGIYAGRGAAEQRDRAFTLLFESAAGPEDIVPLIGAADPEQFGRLLSRLGAQADRDRAVALLTPRVREPARFDDELARRQGRWAMALLRLGGAEAAWPLLRHRDDPSTRTELIHEMKRFGLDPSAVFSQLLAKQDKPSRLAVILSAGEFAIPEAERFLTVPGFLEWYRWDPDPGIHGALDWLLRQKWGRGAELAKIDRGLAGAKPVPGHRWYVNGRGQTFAVIRGPNEFRMGSTKRDDPDRDFYEVPQMRRIGRSFAIATREVTVAEYARFLSDTPGVVVRWDARRPKGSEVIDWRSNPQFQQYIPSPDCAIGTVTWYEAARYCNWLSAKEGIPTNQWCYPKDIGPGMKLPADYLSRTGYRLPTEAEWEYACRAGTESSRPYGRSEAWLAEYGWYLSNSGRVMHPVGRLKPNDLGLFDILGNASEWCSDAYRRDYPSGKDRRPAEDALVDAEVSDNVNRVHRGGTFLDLAADLRSAARAGVRPADHNHSKGFRPARTYP